MHVDAIVNASNNALSNGGGVNGAIHDAAGPELDKACRKLGGCETGDAKITEGFGLPAKYIIHTVGPIWHGGTQGEEEKLASSYRRSLEVAEENGLHSVAFPLLSAGIFGYPKDEAMRVARETIEKYLRTHNSNMDVRLVLFR